ncbi:MAG: hypothetical protein ABW173_05410 [Sphingomonas sp.]
MSAKPPRRRAPVDPAPAGFVAGQLPVLLAALLSPVVIFYGAGYLLSFGYFFVMGPALMTAFGSSELALMGFARLSGPLAVLTFLGFFAVTASVHLGSIRMPVVVPPRFANGVAGIVCFAAAGFVGWASWRANLLAAMLGLVAIFVVAAIGVAVMTGREEAMRRAGHPWRWMLPVVLLVLGLPSLGAAGFEEATRPDGALYVVVKRPDGDRPAMLLAAGAAAMIYQVDGRRFLAGARGEEPVEVGMDPRRMRDADAAAR